MTIRGRNNTRMGAAVRRENGRVWIEGVPDGDFDIHWDMATRAMAALLTFRGVDADLSEFLAISGDAFSLCHASHWQGTAYLAAPTDPVRNLAEAYGFAYATTHAGPTGPLVHSKTREERLAIAQEALGRIRSEIDAGRPVIVAGAEAHCGSTTLVVGYEKGRDRLCHVGDGEPYRWTPLRGVADDGVDSRFGLMDGRARGAVTEGFVGGWQANPAYLIGERVAQPSARDRILAALRRAVELAGAPKAHRRNWGGVDYHFGIEAYEQWAQALESLDYPADLDGPFETNGVEEASDWYEMGNMDMQVDQIVTGRSAAARFCRESAGVLGGSAGDALVQAADAYEAEVEVARRAFEPFIPRFDGNDDPRVQWLSSDSERNAGARAVRQMLQHERRALQAVEQALARTGISVTPVSTRVTSHHVEQTSSGATPQYGDRFESEGDRVVIQGLEGWHMGERGSSPHAAQAAVMQALGEDITYTELLGASGLAFRLQVHKELCPSSPHAFCGKQCVDGSVAALPWEMRVFQVKEDDVEGVRAAREAVKASIDRGIPVVYGSEEDGLIVGYQKDGAEWIAYHPLKKGGRETIVETGWPWSIAVFTERKEEQADRRQLAVSALEMAVEMASAPNVDDYTLGRRAWDTWLSKLKELETTSDLTCAGHMMGNSWIYTTLVEYRTQAAEYLRSVAGLFGKDAAQHLLAAADAYEEMAAATLTDKDHCALDVAPAPWYLKGRTWDNAWRAKQIERLTKARPLEEKAVMEIGRALTAIE